MRWVRLANLRVAAAHGIELPDALSIVLPRLGGCNFFDAIPIPQAVAVAEGRNAAFCTNARASENEDAILRANRNHIAHHSSVTKEHHETEIHVALLMAVKERRTRIRCNKVYFRSAFCFHNQNIFHQATHGDSVKVGDFKGVPMQVDGMVIGAFIPHHETMTLTLLQSDRVGLRKIFSVDHPVIEIAMPGKFRAEDKRNTHIRLRGFARTCELRIIPLRFRRGGPTWLALLPPLFDDD